LVHKELMRSHIFPTAYPTPDSLLLSIHPPSSFCFERTTLM
jgi:hypothetical protein